MIGDLKSTPERRVSANDSLSKHEVSSNMSDDIPAVSTTLKRQQIESSRSRDGDQNTPCRVIGGLHVTLLVSSE